ncbi:MAG: SOS response-associated peptidase [Pirellulaceae bacterium]|nr:SOS response-associated peptidase [Pirellulaceae bacterium]
MSTMCGRFTLQTPVDQLVDQFKLSKPPATQLTLRFNVAPTQEVVAVRSAAGARVGDLLRWGLVPFWSKDLSIGSRLINARSETIAEKPAFRSAFRSRRCLILADGYYEWKANGKRKEPYYIRLRDERPFAFAGLWEKWRQDEQTTVHSCTIITTDSNELTAGLHHRMPVILDEPDYDLWLDPEFEEPAPLLKLLAPYASDRMRFDSVTTHVNNVRNDDVKCVRIQRELF